METESTSMVEDVTKSEVLGLATWDRQRDTAEILSFLARREADIFATEVA